VHGDWHGRPPQDERPLIPRRSAPESAAIGDTNISKSIVRIDLCRADEHLARKLKAFATTLVEELATSKIVVVGGGIGRPNSGNGLPLFIAQDQLQGTHNILGNRILNGENILHFLS